jgi:hypothetical protein
LAVIDAVLKRFRSSVSFAPLSHTERESVRDNTTTETAKEESASQQRERERETESES